MLWLLAPIGLLFATPAIRAFAFASVPVALVFGYVQQPDRALWNLHFVVTPLASLVLYRLPAIAAWATIAFFAIANLRVGAQLMFVRRPAALSGINRIAAAGMVGPGVRGASRWRRNRHEAFRGALIGAVLGEIGAVTTRGGKTIATSTNDCRSGGAGLQDFHFSVPSCSGFSPHPGPRC